MLGLILGLVMALVWASIFICCVGHMLSKQLNDERCRMEEKASLREELKAKMAGEKEYVVDNRLCSYNMFDTDNV